MSKSVPFLIQGNNIILVIDGKSYTINKDTHISYNKILQALKEQDWDVLPDLVETRKALVKFSKEYVTIKDDDVLWKGLPFHNALSTRMIQMFNEGFSIDPMIKFMENLMDNPSKRSVEQLYGFMEKNSLPITEDGHFLAYKKVSKDYKDIHSGTFDNSVGKVVEMVRNSVDDNPDSYCSSGLHFCSESYLSNFGSSDDPVMILKINPADVVSIPTDYDGAKGRCCKYEVVAQVKGSPTEAFKTSVDTEYVSKANWPFPEGNESKDDDSDDFEWDELDYDLLNEDGANNSYDLYDLERVFGGWIEYAGMTLDEARDRVAKNAMQKKAKLRIINSKGDEVQ